MRLQFKGHLKVKHCHKVILLSVVGRPQHRCHSLDLDYIVSFSCCCSHCCRTLYSVWVCECVCHVLLRPGLNTVAWFEFSWVQHVNPSSGLKLAQTCLFCLALSNIYKCNCINFRKGKQTANGIMRFLHFFIKLIKNFVVSSSSSWRQAVVSRQPIEYGVIKSKWGCLWQFLVRNAAGDAAAVRPRLKYALGIICAAARNLPQARISDSRRRWLRQVYEKKYLYIYIYIREINVCMCVCLPMATRSTTVPNVLGTQIGDLAQHFVDNKTIKTPNWKKKEKKRNVNLKYRSENTPCIACQMNWNTKWKWKMLENAATAAGPTTFCMHASPTGRQRAS